MREEIKKIVFRILEMFKKFFYTGESFKLEEPSLIKEYEKKILEHEKTENHNRPMEEKDMDNIEDITAIISNDTFERKTFDETAIILTEMEVGPVQVNIAQMREVLSCFCKLTYTWADQELIDFVKRYGAPK